MPVTAQNWLFGSVLNLDAGDMWTFERPPTLWWTGWPAPFQSLKDVDCLAGQAAGAGMNKDTWFPTLRAEKQSFFFPPLGQLDPSSTLILLDIQLL